MQEPACYPMMLSPLTVFSYCQELFVSSTMLFFPPSITCTSSLFVGTFWDSVVSEFTEIVAKSLTSEIGQDFSVTSRVDVSAMEVPFSLSSGVLDSVPWRFR